jgi:predicted Zn finger-like uncharacterized protein
MSLVTRCPKCQSDFVVKLEQLQALDGLVRCGACAHIFDGFATLQSQLPTLTQRPGVGSVVRADSTAPTLTTTPVPAPAISSTSASIPTPSSALAPTVLRHRAERSEPRAFSESESHAERAEPRETPRSTQRFSFSAQTAEHEHTQEQERSDAMIVGESRLRGDGASVGRTQPEFLVDEVDTPRLKLLLWGLGSVLALALLMVQLAYVYRNDLASLVPAWRPALESLCVKLQCEVSLRRHLERISVSVIAFERQSAADQDAKSAEMTLKFSLRNRFNQAQPWPYLSLELTDASGTIVLRKRLSPNEYLPVALVDKPFAPSQEVSLILPVTVTGLQINGYSLKPFFP